MQFGIFTIGAWHESRTQAQALNEALEQIELADRLGLDEAWLGEHRFSRHGLLSGIFPFMGAVAARTQRIRIGTAVIVLPLHNPILLAEETAMLDVISGGRFNFGIGAGYQAQEFEGVGVNMDESRSRFQESIDVIIKAWTEERLTFHGDYTDVNDLWVLPKPLQQPHPPIYQAVSTSPESIDFAASRNIQVIGGRSHRHSGPSAPGHKGLARPDGLLRPSPRPPEPADVQGDLRRPHHGGGGSRPSGSGRFQLSNPCARPGTTGMQSGCRWTRTATSPRAMSTGPTGRKTATAGTTRATRACRPCAVPRKW